MRLALPITIVAFLLGFVFASTSTYDFVSHLDRQVHGVHCSFIPGLAAADLTGSSGCHATLMSPYSSVLRSVIWGGLPVSLPAMGVFAFLACYAAGLALSGRSADPRAVGFLVAGAALPALTSLGMGWIAFHELSAACKLCIGIYGASALGLSGSVALLREARRGSDRLDDDGYDDDGYDGLPPRPWSPALLGALFALGVAFVAVPAGAYVAVAPDFSRFVGACGALARPDDPHGILVPLGGAADGAEAVEVVDPLCPTCKAFEQRLASSGLGDRLRRKAVLFPLDASCNWMVGTTIHPGACDVSEAVLCAPDRAADVLGWAFEQQEAIKAAAALDPSAAAVMVRSRFPELAACVGSPGAKARLNRSLRWAVANSLPVMTPQLYVRGSKLCDEDIDLGLDWALTRLVDRAAEAR